MRRASWDNGSDSWRHEEGFLGIWEGPWEHEGVPLGTCRVPMNMRSLTFSLQVQNDQCQPMVEESRWMRTTEKGWEFHSVSVLWEVTPGGGPSVLPRHLLSLPWEEDALRG